MRKAADDRRRGRFGMNELLVAAALAVVVAGGAIPLVGGDLEARREERARRELEALAARIAERFLGETGVAAEAGLDPDYHFARAGAGARGVIGITQWLGPSDDAGGDLALVDPWGTPYSYHLDDHCDPRFDVVVVSAGPDRILESWSTALFDQATPQGDDLAATRDVPRRGRNGRRTEAGPKRPASVTTFPHSASSVRSVPLDR